MRHALRFSSLVLLVLGMTAGVSSGQELKPGVLWAAEGSASWSADSSWDFDGAAGVPGEGEVASIKNGGTATVTSAAQVTDALSIGNGTVDVGAGGSLNISGEVVVGGGGVLNLSGDGSVGSTSLANLGTLSLGGSSSIELSGGFANAGTLMLDGGMITAAGTATLSGSTIDVAAAPSLGSPIPFLTSGGVVGQPASITVGGASPSLDRGLGLQVAVDGGAASVALGSIPIAVVNRATGEVTVENAAGGTMDIKGYELMSGNGLLSSDDWNSLTAQGASGWSTIPSSDATVLTELNVAESSTLNVGDSVSLGNAWGGTTVSPRDEDVALNVLLSDGRTLAGAVEYVGPANDLVLNIDPATGNGTLQHFSAALGDLDLVGYTIGSSGGSLNTEGFTGTIGEGFSKPNPQATALSEVSLEQSMVFGNGTSIDLGQIFTPGSAQDLVLEFGIAGSDRSQPGTVEYGGGGMVITCDPNTGGDLDGDGMVAFADFLILSNNFGNAVSSHADGDIDCSGDVAFADFLILSNNFGNAVGAETSAVPEPSSGWMILLGVLGMLNFRKRRLHVAAAVAACGCLMVAAPSETHAQNIPSRFIRIHPEGPNNQINNTVEAMGILNGTVLDVIINEDITEPDFDVLTADFGGGGGNYANDQNPWGNGVEDTTMNDFIQYISGVWEIPEGDYTVGFGSDDGGFFRFTNPDVVFIETFNENGPIADGDGEIIANGTRGHNWTAGTISVPAGGITTGIESANFERGGGDSFEVAYVDAHYDPDADGGRNEFMATGFELDNGEFGDWKLTDEAFVAPGASSDLNNDGNVDFADFTIMSDNWGNPYGFDEFFALTQEFEGAAGEASSVPEPTSITLIVSALAMLFGFRRRRR